MGDVRPGPGHGSFRRISDGVCLEHATPLSRAQGSGTNPVSGSAARAGAMAGRGLLPFPVAADVLGDGGMQEDLSERATISSSPRSRPLHRGVDDAPGRDACRASRRSERETAACRSGSDPAGVRAGSAGGPVSRPTPDVPRMPGLPRVDRHGLDSGTELRRDVRPAGGACTAIEPPGVDGSGNGSRAGPIPTRRPADSQGRARAERPARRACTPAE